MGASRGGLSEVGVVGYGGWSWWEGKEQSWEELRLWGIFSLAPYRPVLGDLMDVGKMFLLWGDLVMD